MDTYQINDLQCQIKLKKNIRMELGMGLIVRLFETLPAAEHTSYLCSWEFYPPGENIEAVSLNFSKLDIHAVRIRTAQGLHLARRLNRSRGIEFSSSLILDVMSTYPTIQAFLIYQCRLCLDAEEIRKINRQIKLNNIPVIEWFFLELTNRCNFQCKWCPGGKMKRGIGTMSFRNAKVALNKIATYRENNPIFSLYAEIRNPVFLHVMGEPLLHHQLFDIIEYGHERGLDFCIFTNASLLDESVIDKILSCGLKFMVLSLNTPDAASFQQTRSNHRYEKVIENIQNLIRERFRRRMPVPRIEIQFLNTKVLDYDIFSALSQNQQVQRTLVFWSDFVREQENLWNIEYPHQGLEEEAEWEKALDEKGLIPGVYYQIGHNIFIVFKQAFNFGNAIIRDNSEVLLALNGMCPSKNAHRTLCVLWDGSCTFCSLDYDNIVKLDNIFEKDIEAIWGSARMNRIRALMENNTLLEPLCQKCQGKVVQKPDYPSRC